MKRVFWPPKRGALELNRELLDDGVPKRPPPTLAADYPPNSDPPANIDDDAVVDGVNLNPDPNMFALPLEAFPPNSDVCPPAVALADIFPNILPVPLAAPPVLVSSFCTCSDLSSLYSVLVALDTSPPVSCNLPWEEVSLSDWIDRFTFTNLSY